MIMIEIIIILLLLSSKLEGCGVMSHLLLALTKALKGAAVGLELVNLLDDALLL